MPTLGLQCNLLFDIFDYIFVPRERGLEEISLYLQLNEILRKSFYGIRDDRNLIYNNIPCEISICILVWKHSSINEEKTNILGKQ